MHSACQVGTVQGHDRSIMVWGIFSGHCLESLISIPTSLKGIRCVESLGDHLHPFVLFCCPHGNEVFQQDKCTSHKSRLATGWLDKNSSDFSVINWPPRNPDLNPIEHLRFFGKRERPSHITELWTAIANVCDREDVTGSRVFSLTCPLGSLEPELMATLYQKLESFPEDDPRLVSDIQISVSAEYRHGLCDVKSSVVKSIPCHTQ
ncbi:transposable element Tcb2 transposase [Trichonephila clavipes]|nr:transposable element Tcb2 transposase [Trichonephila clavipes]